MIINQDQWWNCPHYQNRMRLQANEFIGTLKAEYDGVKNGRGIVIVGGGRYLVSAYITIKVLRRVGCTLPIELWHLKDEVDDVMALLLSKLGVVCIDADNFSQSADKKFPFHHTWWKGWQLKAYAITHSNFDEVLFLDADCYPTVNPTFLFDWLPYRERGAVFWPDLKTSWHLLPDTVWGIFGATPGLMPIESGEMLINKNKCWRELQLALWYNAHADYTYRIVWGDKDTFNIAWRRLGTYYAMTHHSSDYDTHTIRQYGIDGKVLFQHRCQDKFHLDENVKYQGTSQRSATNEYNPRLVHEDYCFNLLNGLRLIINERGKP